MPQFYVAKAYNGKYENMLYKCLMSIENSTKKFINDYVYIGNIKNYRLPSNEAPKGYEKSQPHLVFIDRLEKYIVNNYNNWRVAEISFKKTGKAKKWGVKIDDDDTAYNVQKEYEDLLRQGIDNEEVTKQMIDKWDTEDIEDGPIFWFALAEKQWNYGRLLENVKEKALYYIKTGTDLESWKEDKALYSKRKKVLEELEEKLNSPMRRPIKIAVDYKCPWSIGDVYAYKIKKDKENKGKYIVIIKIGEASWRRNICPMVYIYNKLFDKLPTIEELKNVKYIPTLPSFCTPESYKGEYENMLYKERIDIDDSSRKLVNRYVYIGNIKNYPVPSNETTNEKISDFCAIVIFEEKMIENYNKWKGIDYSN